MNVFILTIRDQSDFGRVCFYGAFDTEARAYGFAVKEQSLLIAQDAAKGWLYSDFSIEVDCLEVR